MFVKHLIEALAKGLDLKALQERVLSYFGKGLNAQQARAARTLALVATAGEIATMAEILPWEQGRATATAVELFAIWKRGQKSSPKGTEHAKILENVQDFIAKHSDPRF